MREYIRIFALGMFGKYLKKKLYVKEKITQETLAKIPGATKIFN